MWTLLAVVAGAAAVLSFSALRDLALLCGFAPGLAWLLPIVVDAGAAAGCLSWAASVSFGVVPTPPISRCRRLRTMPRPPRGNAPTFA